jgi:hypothetical protein
MLRVVELYSQPAARFEDIVQRSELTSSAEMVGPQASNSSLPVLDGDLPHRKVVDVGGSKSSTNSQRSSRDQTVGLV